MKELKIRYRYRTNINLIEIWLIKSNFFFTIKNVKKKRFKIIMLINETVEPTTIEIGINKNNKKKKFSLITKFI